MAKTYLDKSHLVVKQNNFNELRSTGMTLQELRFFSIYLSKINPKDKSTRVVRFSLASFQAIMGFSSRLNMGYLRSVVDGLLTKVTSIPTEENVGEIRFQLFKRCRISEDENGDWYVEIDAHDDALPLMFDFRSHYFKYELWNTLSLKSKNQFRMYEILKQYESAGVRIISIADLREQLGVDKKEYPQYKEFKRCVLEVCRKALAERTDISYTYEPSGKKGQGGKIHELKFLIAKNKNYKDPITLEKFIDLQATKTEIEAQAQEMDFIDTDENGNMLLTGTHPWYEERIAFLMSACNNEFSREQIIVLLDNMPDWAKQDSNNSHDYLQSKYREMDMRKPDKSRFGYLRALILKQAHE